MSPGRPFMPPGSFWQKPRNTHNMAWVAWWAFNMARKFLEILQKCMQNLEQPIIIPI